MSTKFDKYVAKIEQRLFKNSIAVIKIKFYRV